MVQINEMQIEFTVFAYNLVFGFLFPFEITNFSRVGLNVHLFSMFRLTFGETFHLKI